MVEATGQGSAAAKEVASVARWEPESAQAKAEVLAAPWAAAWVARSGAVKAA